MSADLKKRFAILAVLVVIALLFLYPTLRCIAKGSITTEDMLAKGWISRPITLGLDLRGGVHLVYDVQVDEAVKSRLQSFAMGIREDLRDEKIAVTKTRVTDTQDVEITLLSDRNVEKAEGVIADKYSSLSPKGKRNEGGAAILVYSMSPSAVMDIKRAAVSRAIETLRTRVDAFGLTEPLIQQVGEYRIMLQLPGSKDIEYVKRIVGRVARLEFRFLPRPGVETGAIKLQNRDKQPVTVEDQIQLTGDAVQDATVGNDRTGQVEVELQFTPEGSKRFAKVSGDNVGRDLAIILDGVVYSSPEIRDRIAGGRASITGGFSYQEATELQKVLRAGALPAPLKIVEESQVGPTLGEASVRAGILSILIGFGAILAFMFVYYKKAGAVACLTLAFNLFFLVAILSAFGATLTLPGMAGLALTIGMAVDANVIIYERIREELKIGASRDVAVEAGFHKALSAIVDSNLTTLISGFILYYFGTGSVRGFAVTLCIGIATTIFCATFLSRLFIDYWPLRGRYRGMSI